MRALKRTLAVALAVSLLAASPVLAGCKGCGRTPFRVHPNQETTWDSPAAAPSAPPSDDAFSKAAEVEIFKNSNDGPVEGGSVKPVTFTLAAPTTISYIQTYHWDSGKSPGEISLRGPDGTVYGPWKATGTEGQGGMPNAYWEVKPDQTLQPGTYTVVDSDPGSWSTNGEMGMAGQTIVRGYPE